MQQRDDIGPMSQRIRKSGLLRLRVAAVALVLEEANIGTHGHHIAHDLGGAVVAAVVDDDICAVLGLELHGEPSEDRTEGARRLVCRNHDEDLLGAAHGETRTASAELVRDQGRSGSC